MTLLGGLARRGYTTIENPGVPLTDPSIASWFSGPKSDAGVAVTEQRVLGLPAYYRALSLTAGALGSLPLHTFKQGTREKVSRTTVLDKPNPRQTSLEYKVTTFMHQIAWGNAFSRKVRDGSGMVREVWPLHPGNVRVILEEPTAANPSGKWFLVNLPRNADGSGATELRLTPHDVIHLPYMSMDGVQGIRPMQVFRQSLGIAIAGDDSTAKFIANGSRLSGIISTDAVLDKEGTAAKRIKARWKELTGGVENSGEIAILDSGAKFLPISIPPVDAQLLEGRGWSVTEIGRMVGVPPHLLGDLTKSTSWGTGVEQQTLGWLKFTLQTLITGSEQRWSEELLLPREYCEHSLEGLLRGDSASRAAFHHSAITDGWANRNEVREIENLMPVDGLDEFIVPSNMTLISVDGQLVPLSSAGVAPAGGIAVDDTGAIDATD